MIGKIRHFNSFIVRRPLLSPHYFFKKEEVDLDELLDVYLKHPHFIESLYINAKDVDFVRLIAETTDRKKQEKIKQTLLRYINRCSFQSTPFGLNALVGVGQIKDRTNGHVSGNGAIKRRLRLDSAFLYSICQDLLKDGDVRSNIKLFANNSIYRTGERYRYAEFRLKGDNREYVLSAFDHSGFMEAVLSFCRPGRRKREIIEFMMGLDGDLAFEECDAFLDEMWESKILIDDFEPWIVGKDYGTQVIDILEYMNENTRPNDRTNATLGVLRDFYEKAGTFLEKTCVSKEEYIGFTSPIRELYPDVNGRNFVQVDGMTEEDHLSLSSDLIDEIKKGMATLTKFSDKITNGRLASFKNELYERYGYEAKKLVEVLDPDIGIGYPANAWYGAEPQNIIDGIPPPAMGFGDGSTNLSWKSKRDALLVAKTIAAVKANSSVITFSDKELEAVPSKMDALPPTFAVSVSLIDRGGKQLISFNEIGTSSALTTIGRFAMNDVGISALAREISGFEETLCPNHCLSEINHLTDPVIGNITIRPNLYKHEIPYITKSNNDDTNNLIDLNDIYIRIVDDEIVLQNSEGVEIVPRLSNAHNYNLNALSVYKFLCDLQDAQAGYVQFQVDTAVLRQVFSFVPRIVYKNCIFHPATWILETREIAGRMKSGSADGAGDRLMHYLTEKGIPSKFYMKTDHNFLFVNTAHSSSLFFMEKELGRSGRVEISECLYESFDELFLNAGTQRFFHEMVIPFGNGGFVPKPKPVRSITDDTVKKRKFFPGEEWISLKIYGSNSCLQRVVTKCLINVVRSIKKSDEKAQWFFLRYADPKPHLRIRVRSSIMAIHDVLRVFRSHVKDLIDLDSIWKITIDTYQRELERYKPEYIDMCEEIFEMDSWFVLNYHAKKGQATEKDRIFVALSLFCLYFRAFGFDNEVQHAFLKDGRDMFSAEFRANKAHRLFFSKCFRQMEEEIELFMNDFNGDRQLQILFQDYAAWLERVAGNISPDDIAKTLRSLLHMNLLRLFPSNNRKYEYFVYSILEHRLRRTIGRKLFVR